MHYNSLYSKCISYIVFIYRKYILYILRICRIYANTKPRINKKNF